MGDSARTNKEKLYDDHISGLMDQIIAACREHKINVAAQFSLGFDDDQGEMLYCTTVMTPDQSDVDGVAQIMRVRRTMVANHDSFAITTVISDKRDD